MDDLKTMEEDKSQRSKRSREEKEKTGDTPNANRSRSAISSDESPLVTVHMMEAMMKALHVQMMSQMDTLVKGFQVALSSIVDQCTALKSEVQVLREEKAGGAAWPRLAPSPQSLKGVPQVDPTIQNRVRPKVPIEEQRCFDSETAQGCSYGTGCKRLHSPRPPRYCWSFVKTGDCSRGEGCKFVHENPPADQLKAAVPTHQKPCYAYQFLSGCKKSNCVFAHVKIVKSLGTCTNFRDKGACQFGR